MAAAVCSTSDGGGSTSREQRSQPESPSGASRHGSYGLPQTAVVAAAALRIVSEGLQPAFVASRGNAGGFEQHRRRI